MCFCRGIYYSELYDIVNSDKWANLIPETGEKSVLGMKHSEETKKKISEKNSGKFYGNKETLSMSLKDVWADPNSVFNTSST